MVTLPQLISLIVAVGAILMGLFFNLYWGGLGFILGALLCLIWLKYASDSTLKLWAKRLFGGTWVANVIIVAVILIHHWMIGYLFIIGVILSELNIVPSFPIAAAFALSFGGILIIDDYPDIDEEFI